MSTGKLGFWSIVLLGINNIIGSGIFLLPNKAMGLIGPASLLVLLFDMLLVLAIVFCFAEASGLFSEDGGPYIYAHKAFGNFVGYEVGFLTWISRCIAYSTMGAGFATALAGVIPELNNPFMKNVIITVYFILLAIINIMGVQLYKIVQNAATIAKVVPFVLFICMGVFYIQPANFTPRCSRAAATSQEPLVLRLYCCSLPLPALNPSWWRPPRWITPKRTYLRQL
jgi:amino acid transporter